MKIATDHIRAFEPLASRATNAPATSPQAQAPEDRVTISAAASGLHEQEAAESKAKVETMKRALAEGKNIVDFGRIADGILADASGDL